MLKRFLSIALIVVFAGFAAAAAGKFRHIGAKYGLDNGFVSDMAIDGNGFVWVGTEWGLHKITGADAAKEEKADASVSIDGITSLHYHADTDRLLIGTRRKGLYIYDCGTGLLSRMTVQDGLVGDEIRDLTAAEDGGVWILLVNRGLQHFNPQTGELVEMRPENNERLAFSGRSIVAGGGKLYLSNYGYGLSILDINENTITAVQGAPLPSDFTRSLLLDSRRNLWIGTIDGLAMMNTRTGEITNTDKSRLAGTNIQDLLETDDGEIWVASDPGGITVITQTPAGLEYRTITPENSPLASPKVLRLLQDRYGNMWVGHQIRGVDFIAPTGNLFSNIGTLDSHGKKNSTYSVAVGPDGTLWAGGEGYITAYRGRTPARKYTIPIAKDENKGNVSTIFPDSKGKLWIGIINSGLKTFDPATGAFRTIDLGMPLDVNAFIEEPDGTMLVGTERSLFVVRDGMAVKNPTVNTKLKSPVISSMLRLPSGELWIATNDKGIGIFDADLQMKTHLDESAGIPANDVRNVFQDSDGRVWASTASGLVLFPNPAEPEKFTVYNGDDGLADNHIQTVTEDRRGNIWAATFGGISCLMKGENTFMNFDSSDGLPEGGFYRNSVASDSAGSIYMDSPYGLVAFNPADVYKREPLSPTRLVDVSYLDKGNTWRSILPVDGQIVLPHDVSTVTVRYALENFSQAQMADFSYMMEGMDDRWHENGADNKLTFRNLSPGKYVLHIRARLRNGSWTDCTPLDLKIEVLPPWYAAWYMLVVYVLVVLAMIVYLFMRYRRRLLQKNFYEIERKSIEMERRKHQNEQELNNERLRFYTNIAHELRTPLSLIIGPMEDLASEKTLPDKLRPQIDSIHSHCVRLLNLINQLMEFRKTETGNRKLAVTKGNLEEFVSEIGLRFRELHRNANVEFRVEAETLGRDICFDRDVVTTIITNFISNAIKYTVRGHIVLRLVKRTENGVDYAFVNVEDSGYGIDAVALPHIFDRYYQAKGNHQASGTGIGLALVKSLADLHKGILKVESKIGEGSVFSFGIRMDETYPEAEHKEDKTASGSSAEEAPVNDSDVRNIILVVEDNADIRDYLKRIFGDNYTVIEACNGKEGLEMAAKHIPDIIISDVMMPEMDGIEMCRVIKSDLRTSHIPVIILTAKDSIRDREEGFETGADSYVTKPFSGKLLRLRVRNILNGRHRLAQMLMASRIPALSGSEDTQPEPPSKEDAEAVKNPVLSPLDSEFLSRLEGLVAEGFNSGKLDVPFLADSMNMSHSTFYRKVKMLTGYSPVDYVKKMKLRKSAELLASGKYSISDIIYMTGFNTPSNFRESFKAEYGMSPSQYVASLKKA